MSNLVAYNVTKLFIAFYGRPM